MQSVRKLRKNYMNFCLFYSSKEDIHISSSLVVVAGTNIAGGLKSSSASSLLSTSTSEANIAKTSDPEITKSSDHIYEEIQSNEKKESTASQKRPLPPIPGHKGKR